MPLRWHLPTGVLFDLFAHGDVRVLCSHLFFIMMRCYRGHVPHDCCAHALVHPLAAFDTLCPLRQELPWCLTLHFSGVEAKGLLPYEGESSIKSHFRQALKEASSLRYGELSCQHARQPVYTRLMQLKRPHAYTCTHSLTPQVLVWTEMCVGGGQLCSALARIHLKP